MSFYPYSKTFNSDTFDYDALEATDYVFMRWKEHFLVPDHTIKDINGASFAGFYYICFQKSESSVEGFYFHRHSEWCVQSGSTLSCCSYELLSSVSSAMYIRVIQKCSFLDNGNFCGAGFFAFGQNT